jgi:hypothetical protein
MSDFLAAKPNPALEPFGVLVGTWNTVGTHGHLPGVTLHGQNSFEWLEGGAFLIMHAHIDDPRFPVGITIIGSDDARGEFYMLYFYDRGVSRKYDLSIENNVWTWWRHTPEFSQRYSWTLADDGETIIAKGEISRDGLPWEKDLELTFSRVK